METFKNAGATLSTSPTTVYTCPANKKAIVIGCQVSNSTTTAKELTLHWYDSSNESLQIFLGQVSIPTKAVYDPINGKFVLEAGDYLEASSSASFLDITVSVLEIEG